MKPIGIIKTGFNRIENMPIQPRGGQEFLGTATLEEEYMEGLQDLDGFSHIYLIYLFNKTREARLKVVPFMDTVARGVFATRSPARPNPIGMSLVELVEVKGADVVFRGVDILDNTPLLDIKPFIAEFDRVEESRSGWMVSGGKQVEKKRSDSRFE